MKLLVDWCCKVNVFFPSLIYCFCRFSVHTDTTQYYAYTYSVPSAIWFQGVFVYHGPLLGISMYIDGNLESSVTGGWERGGFGSNAGEVVLGREFTSLEGC